MPRTARLHHPAPVDALAAKVALLPLAERSSVWRAYKQIRKVLRRRRLAADSARLVALLSSLAAEAVGYRSAMYALELARAYTVQELALQGAPARPYRAVADEALKLVRLGVREALGLRQPRREMLWRSRAQELQESWVAIADGSFKRSRSAIGFQVFDPRYTLTMEVGFPIIEDTPVGAELRASIAALEALRAVGARHALLLVDAQSVLSAVSGGLPLRYSVLEAQLAQVVAEFDILHVRRVPRTVTFDADRLASAWSAH